MVNYSRDSITNKLEARTEGIRIAIDVLAYVRIALSAMALLIWISIKHPEVYAMELKRDKMERKQNPDF